MHCAGCPIVVDGTRCRDPVKIPVGHCWNMSSSKNPRSCYGKGTKMYQGNEAQLVAVFLFRFKDSDHMNHMKHVESLPGTTTMFFWTSLVSFF